MILFPNDFPTLTAKQQPSSEGLQNAEKVLKEAKERFRKNPLSTREDKEIITEELDFTFDFMIFSCQFGRIYVQNVWEKSLEKVSLIFLLFSPLYLRDFPMIFTDTCYCCNSNRSQTGPLYYPRSAHQKVPFSLNFFFFFFVLWFLKKPTCYN
jgi:hypothetical protein